LTWSRSLSICPLSNTVSALPGSDPTHTSESGSSAYGASTIEATEALVYVPQIVEQHVQSIDAQAKLVDRGVCPLCGSAGSHVYMDFADIPVQRCSHCQFMYSAKLMAPDELSRYYSNDFGSERHRRGQIVNATTNAWVVRKLLSEGALSTPQSILDVGTGYGFFLREIGKLSVQRVVGVELSKQEASYGRDHLGLDIRNSPLSQAGFSAGNFDLVTAFEVIEHVRDPLQFLHEMLKLVRPGGWLLVMTDNFESDVTRSLGAAFPKWIPHSHISHFSPATLERAVAESGGSLVRRVSYTPWELILKTLKHRTIGRELSVQQAFNLKDTLETEMHGHYALFNTRRVLNRFWVRATLADNLNGALMYCLAQKRST